MKFAMILLSAMVVVTHQQYFYQQQRAMPWWSPYSAQRVVKNYLPAYYDNDIDNNSPFYRHYRPSRPVTYYQDEDELNLEDLMSNQDSDVEVEYQDVQSRAKGFNRFRNPSYLQQDLENKGRFFINLLSTSANPLFRTIKFTITSTINITSVQSCIAASLFTSAAAQNNICRRKRQNGLDVFFDETETDQFMIEPTETQPLMPTELPSIDTMGEDRDYPGIASSKDEVNVEEKGRKKRFFNVFLTSSTVTSYSFLTTTVTKSVAIASVAAAGVGGAAPAGPLLCRPAGYVIC